MAGKRNAHFFHWNEDFNTFMAINDSDHDNSDLGNADRLLDLQQLAKKRLFISL